MWVMIFWHGATHLFPKFRFLSVIIHLTNICFFANNQLGPSIISEKPELNVVLPDNKHNAGPQIL